MRCHYRLITPVLWTGVLLAAPAAWAQLAPANYTLTAPAWLGEPELTPSVPFATFGGVRLATASSFSGNGLSLEAGEKWFARAGIGRTLDNDIMSVGGGYRFADGNALSMHVTRQLGQERLGLALRYDLRSSFLRLSYEQPVRTPGAHDSLRFSAGVRF